MGCYIRAASADDVAPGNAKLVEIDGKSIALFNIGGLTTRSTMPARIRVGRSQKAHFRVRK